MKNGRWIGLVLVGICGIAFAQSPTETSQAGQSPQSVAGQSAYPPEVRRALDDENGFVKATGALKPLWVGFKEFTLGTETDGLSATLKDAKCTSVFNYSEMPLAADVITPVKDKWAPVVANLQECIVVSSVFGQDVEVHLRKLNDMVMVIAFGIESKAVKAALSEALNAKYGPSRTTEVSTSREHMRRDKTAELMRLCESDAAAVLVSAESCKASVPELVNNLMRPVPVAGHVKKTQRWNVVGASVALESDNTDSMAVITFATSGVEAFVERIGRLVSIEIMNREKEFKSRDF